MSCMKFVKVPTRTFRQIVRAHLGLHELREVREIAQSLQELHKVRELSLVKDCVRGCVNA